MSIHDYNKTENSMGHMELSKREQNNESSKHNKNLEYKHPRQKTNRKILMIMKKPNLEYRKVQSMSKIESDDSNNESDAKKQQ